MTLLSLRAGIKTAIFSTSLLDNSFFLSLSKDMTKINIKLIVIKLKQIE